MKQIILQSTPTGCMECVSHKVDQYGYPRLRRNGTSDRVFRYVYAEKYGAVPKGTTIMHVCDNRKCCNLDHLKIGTIQENVQDRVRKGRSAYGTRNGRSKLSEDDVRMIYNDRTTKKMHLAVIFQVDPKVIRDIQQGITWKHLTSISH